MGNNHACIDRRYDGGALSKAVGLDKRIDATSEQVDLITKKGMVVRDQIQGYRRTTILYAGLWHNHRNLDPGDPSGLAHTAREDAWMASLFSILINLLMVVLYIAIARVYPGQTIFEIHEKVLGKFAGKDSLPALPFYFLILTGTLLGNLGFPGGEMMPDTPIEAIQILFLIAAVMCARMGIILLARVSELMFPWIVFLFLVLVLSLIPQIDWNHIMPMLEEGWMPVAKAGFHSSMFQELIVLMTFCPWLGERKGEGIDVGSQRRQDRARHYRPAQRAGSGH